MMYRLIALTLLLAGLGCSKSKPTNSGDSGGDSKGDTTAYTIDLRRAQKGDKVHVIKTRDGESTTSFGKNKPQKKIEKYQYDFTENVIEMPVGSPKPTRADRTYKTARKSDDSGELKPLSFEGKTVEVQVSPFEGIGYIFIVGGNAIQPPDRDDLLQEFQGGEKPNKDAPPKSKLEDIIPKTPIRVGEEWALDVEAIKAFTGEMPFPLDKEKSKIVGKLVKVYQQDGKRCGVIDVRITMVMEPNPKGPPLSGAVTADVTIDGVIDGSSPARTVKLKGQGKLSAPVGKDAEVKIDLAITQDEAVTPLP